MVVKIVSLPPTAHRCEGFPKPEEFVAGTQGQCEECDQLWVVVEGAQYNQTYRAWRKLTNANKEGQDV